MTQKLKTRGLIGGLVTAGLLLGTTIPASAQTVTLDRLVHPEPENWLTNHGNLAATRYSALDQINADNAHDLDLAYTIPLMGVGEREYLQATPLVDGGFMYMVDGLGVLYKIDVTNGFRAQILWTMDPAQERAGANRGAALLGDNVYTVANSPARVIATNKETGEIVWEADVSDEENPRAVPNMAPLATDDKILVGASGGDGGARDWIAAFDAETGEQLWKQFTIPAPGEPGSETWSGDSWMTGGGAVYVTGSWDPETNIAYWGIGNPVPMYDAEVRPGDNLYTNSVLATDADTGELVWYHQYTPGDMWDYDEAGTHILIEGEIEGEQRNLVTHSGRNGFLYTFDRETGGFFFAEPYLDNINWTAGIDQETGLPVDYDPDLERQVYAGVANLTPDTPPREVCPAILGGNNFWPATYSQNTNLLYIPSGEGCVTVTYDPEARNGGTYVYDKLTSSVIAQDPLTGEIKGKLELDYPNYGGAISTAGGLIFTGLLDGTFLAIDDETLEVVWDINLGSGINAPPMTFAVDGKQYVAIATGAGFISRGKTRGQPELANQRQATVLYVFALDDA